MTPAEGGNLPPSAGSSAAGASSDSLAEALLELQRLTERLRRECPWDREQTAATIVPHTVEESYEVADTFYGAVDIIDEAIKESYGAVEVFDGLVELFITICS